MGLHAGYTPVSIRSHDGRGLATILDPHSESVTKAQHYNEWEKYPEPFLSKGLLLRGGYPAVAGPPEDSFECWLVGSLQCLKSAPVLYQF